MTNLINVLCIVLLLAAFTPSAIRLYVIGSETFGAAVSFELAAVAVGSAVGLVFYQHRNAAHANHTLLINSIKPHIDFRNPVENGLTSSAWASITAQAQSRQRRVGLRALSHPGGAKNSSVVGHCHRRKRLLNNVADILVYAGKLPA